MHVCKVILEDVENKKKTGGKQLGHVPLMFIPAVRRDADRWEPHTACRLEGQFREQGRPLWEALVMFSASDLKPDTRSVDEDSININQSEHGWNTSECKKISSL